MAFEDIEKRFKHHSPTAEKITQHEDVRSETRLLAHYFDDELPESREKALALTKLEEALFWANAAIARN